MKAFRGLPPWIWQPVQVCLHTAGRLHEIFRFKIVRKEKGQVMMKMYVSKMPSRIIAFVVILAMLTCLLPAGQREAAAATKLQNPEMDSDGIVTWDCVWFGHYPQSSDGNGGYNKDPIKWRVLSVEGNEALLLAEQNLDAGPYNETLSYVNWQTCTLRSWLNGYGSDTNSCGKSYIDNNFLNKAFTTDEQELICEKNAPTKDKIFLLSDREASNTNYGFHDTYDSTPTRSAKNTEYAVSRGGTYGVDVNDFWWLRNQSGNMAGTTQRISTVGFASGHSDGYDVDDRNVAIRPALRLNLLSDAWSYAGTVSTGTSFSMTENWIETTVGSNCLITANLKLEKKNSLDPEKDLVWSSSDESVLKFIKYSCVESEENPERMIVTAEFKPLKNGRVTVSAKAGNKERSCTVIVGKTEGNTIQGDTSGAPSSKLKITNDVDFTIPKDVPLIGKEKISIKFNKIPIEFEQEGNKYTIGIGIHDLQELNKGNREKWTSFKKFVSTQKESYRKGVKEFLDSTTKDVSMGMPRPKVNMQCFGYAEGIITNDGVQSCNGKLKIEIKAQAKSEWQTTVVVVPVVIKFGGEVGAKAEATITFDFEKASIGWKNDLELTLPKLKLSAGIGVKHIADISLYGSASNLVKITPENKLINQDKRITGTLKGAIGVSAKLLFVEYEKDLLPGKREYYDSKKSGSHGFSLAKSLDNADWSVDRKKASAWKGTKPASKARTAAVDEVRTLQENIYDDGKPYLVQTENGKKVLVYTADLSGRTLGNHTAIVYSVFNEDTDTWSVPVVIDDDETGDYYPSVTAKGENVYVTWVNASKIFSEKEAESDDFLSTVAAACEIEVANIDISSGEIKTESLTDNKVLDYKPSIYNRSGVLSLAWIRNLENDVLTMSGTNQIYTATLNGDSWSKPEQLSSETQPITSLAMGKLGGTPGAMVAYTVSKNGIGSSLYIVDKNKNRSLIKEGVICAKPTFGQIGDERILAWYQENEGDSTIQYITSSENGQKKLCDGELAVTPDFQIISGNDNKALLVCASSKDETDGSNIAAYILEDTASSEQVSLTDLQGYAASPTGVYDKTSGSWDLAFLRKDVTIGDSEVSEKTDLCATSIFPKSKLEIKELDFIEENMMPGKTEDMELAITNNGLVDCDKYVVQLVDGTEVVSTFTVNAGLKAGESKTVATKVSLPKTMAKHTDYVVRVVPKDDSGEAFESRAITVGKVDTELTVKESGGAYTIEARNSTGFSTSARLIIKDTDASGAELFSHDLGTIAPYGKTEMVLEKETLTAKGVDCLYLQLDSGEKELFDSNNEAYLYVGKDLMAPLERISASKGKNVYGINEKLDLSDLKVTATYGDGISKVVTGYDTNVNEIDMATPGEKKLTIMYEENFTVRTVSIPITVTKQEAKPPVSSTTGDEGTPISGKTVKRSQNIIAKSFVKTYGNKPFYLRAKAKTKLTYKSTNGKVATVNSAGRVTIKDTGRTTITITALADKNYNGAFKNITVTVKPKKTTLKKAKPTQKGTLKLTWKRDKKATGYQAIIATDKKFKKNKKTVTIKTNKTVSKTFKKLKSKKTYFAKVRAYKQIGKKKVYGAYSKVKKAKIK